MCPQGYIRSDGFQYSNDTVLYASKDTSFLSTSEQPPLFEEAVLKDRSGWVGFKSFLLLMVSLAIFSYFFGQRSKQLSIYMRMLVRQDDRVNQLEDSDIPIRRFQIVFTLISYCILSLFVALCMQDEGHSSLMTLTSSLIWRSFTLFGGYLIVRFMLLWMFEYFLLPISARRYVSSNLAGSIHFYALLLTLLMLANELLDISYSMLLISSWILLLLIKIYTLTKTAYIFSRQRLSVFYFILYLCALEILPLCILYKSIFLIGQSM